MGITIDTPLIAYSEQTGEIYVIDEKAKYCVTDKVMKAVVATNRAIPKADYETRLKAEKIAMLEELRLEADKLKGPQCNAAYWVGFFAYDDFVKEKINALKGKGADDGNNVRQTD